MLLHVAERRQTLKGLAVIMKREPRPGLNEPGTLQEQLEAIDLYLSDPTRKTDPNGAWLMSRRLTMPHVRERLKEQEVSGDRR